MARPGTKANGLSWPHVSWTERSPLERPTCRHLLENAELVIRHFDETRTEGAASCINAAHLHGEGFDVSGSALDDERQTDAFRGRESALPRISMAPPTPPKLTFTILTG